MRLLESIHNYDLLTFDWCLRRKRRNLVVKVSRWISFTANGPLYVISGVFFLIAQNWAISALLALGFIIERGTYTLAKTHFRRNRPPQAIPGYVSEIIPSDQFSFPSGHTSAAFLMAGCITFAFPLAAWVLYPWACMVGIARVMLGVHFPSDILAGAILGTIICKVLTGLIF